MIIDIFITLIILIVQFSWPLAWIRIFDIDTFFARSFPYSLAGRLNTILTQHSATVAFCYTTTTFQRIAICTFNSNFQHRIYIEDTGLILTQLVILNRILPGPRPGCR